MATLEALLGGYMGFMGFYMLLFAVSVTVFLLRRNLQPIEPRNISLSLISATAGLVHCIFLAVDLALQPLPEMAPTTCILVVAGSTLLLPLWALPFFFRCFLLVFKHNWHVEKLNLSIMLGRAGLRRVDDSSIHSGLSNAESDISLKEIAGPGEGDPTGWKISPNAHPRPSFSAPAPGWYSRNKWLTSNKFIYPTIAGITVIHVLATVIADRTQNSDFGSDFGSCISNLVIPFAVFTGIYFLVLLVLIFKLWKVRDAFFIKTELRVSLFLGLPLFVAWLICYLVPIPAELSPAWFVMAAIFMLFLVVICYPIYLSTLPYWYLSKSEYELQPAFFARFSHSHHSKKTHTNTTQDESSISDPRESDVSRRPAKIADSRVSDVSETSSTAPMAAATQAKVSAKDIPQDSLLSYLMKPQFLESFEKFCVQAWCVELVLFFVDSEKFPYMKGEDMKTEAKRIVKMYLTDDAELELENISTKVLDDIKTKIAADQISSTLFAEARMEVYDQMCKFIFPIWQKSAEFKRLVSEVEQETATTTTSP